MTKMGKKKKKGLVAALCVIAVIVLLAAAYGIFCLIIEDDKIWADASVNGVNIQGMSKKEAAQTVEQKFEEDYKDTAVTVELDGQQYTMNVFPMLGMDASAEIEKAYEQAIDLFDGEKYDDAIEVLKSAYNSDLDTYYHKHILFLLASCYYEKNQFKEAIGYYEEYIAKYDETYIEEIYYKLALAYEDTDLNKSKKYAEHIKKEFSNSIYNNSKISQIISK